MGACRTRSCVHGARGTGAVCILAPCLGSHLLFHPQSSLGHSESLLASKPLNETVYAISKWEALVSSGFYF